jgi:hypothetical protein
MGSYDLTATANTLNHGILAARVASIFSHQNELALGDDEMRFVLSARHLVDEILAGARTLTDETVSGASAESISSLGSALSPLERLRLHCGHTDEQPGSIVTALQEILEALQRTEQERMVRPDQRTELAKYFFAFLADSMLSSMNHRDRQSENG